jgi:hypothetical protein
MVVLVSKRCARKLGPGNPGVNDYEMVSLITSVRLVAVASCKEVSAAQSWDLDCCSDGDVMKLRWRCVSVYRVHVMSSSSLEKDERTIQTTLHS